MVQISLTLALAALLTEVTIAHPAASGHHHARNSPADISARASYVQNSRRTLAGCSEQLRKRGHEKAAVARRNAVVEKHRRALDLVKRERTSPANSTTVAAVSAFHFKTFKFSN